MEEQSEKETVQKVLKIIKYQDQVNSLPKEGKFIIGQYDEDSVNTNNSQDYHLFSFFKKSR